MHTDFESMTDEAISVLGAGWLRMSWRRTLQAIRELPEASDAS